MGLPEPKRAPPLPAPTDTDSISAVETGTEIGGTEISRGTAQTLPEDGTPITFTKSSRHKDRVGISRDSHDSKTSLLIEYFEGGKGSEAETRKPSVRVKVTPSSKSRRSKDDHIQITETKGTRKPSYTKRINLASGSSREEKVRVEGGDHSSMSSYASATEESNVSRNPIEIEVMSRRPSSPLIPRGDKRPEIQLGSDVSSMQANSFLDGKTRSPERPRSRSLTRGEIAATGAAAGLAVGVIADTLKTPSRRRSRSLSRERILVQKAAEKVKSDKSERRRKSSGSRSRSASNAESTSVHSPRRRSSRNHHEDVSLVSGAEVSQLSGSRVSGDQRSYRSATSKTSSINNPKLLETVEDAIRRLILPELTALKKEQKANREKFDRDRRGSITSGSTGVSRESREDIRKVSGGRSSGPEGSSKSRVVVDGKEILSSDGKLRKERRSDYARSSESPRGIEKGESEETVIREGGDRLRTKRSSDKKTGLGALAAGLGLGALTAHALHNQSRENLSSKESLDERTERRRRRTKSRSRSDSLAESYDSHFEVQPPMPLMSDINASDITRSSILSVETDRPASASHERLITKEVRRGFASPSSRTPTRTPRSLTPNELTPTQRATVIEEGGEFSQNTHSRDLVYPVEYDLDENGRKVQMHGTHEEAREEEYHEDRHDGGQSQHYGTAIAGAAAGAVLGAAAAHHYGNKGSDPHELEEEEEEEQDYYQQAGVVPPPLRYVPYNQEKRGLSPIQSVSGYTEDEIGHSGNQATRESRLTHSTGSYSTERSPQHRQSGVSEGSDQSPLRNHHDFADVRQGGLAESELTQDQDGDYWEEQHRLNDMNRDLDEESYRSLDPRLDYEHYAGDSFDGAYRSDRVAAGQSVRGVGGKPDFVHTPVPIESVVASLLDGSEVTGNSGNSGRSGLDRQASYASYDEGSERHFTSRGSPLKHDSYGSRDFEDRQLDTQSPGNYPEYELDDQGRKIAMPQYEDSHTGAKVAAAGLVGVTAGAAAAAISNRRHEPESSTEHYQERLEHTGAPLQKSFKDRARDLQPISPRHSVDRFEDETHVIQTPVKMTASGIPDANDPMPEIGAYHDDLSEANSHESYVKGPLGGEQHGSLDHWPNQPTPKHPAKLDTSDAVIKGKASDSRLKEAELAILAAAGAAGAAAAVGAHNRETSQDHDDQWPRTSEDRKRDTLITNPYEGTSPVTLLGGQQDRNLLDQMGYDGVSRDYERGNLGYTAGSPGLVPKDEGYISSAPNAHSPGPRRQKEVGFMDDVGIGRASEQVDVEDPFYTPKHSRHLSGLSNGMGSPLYDSATGAGIDRIQSKDIVALMDHLTVRDAQRSARDTEILVTLVRAAAEMRNSFEDMKRLLADTEDVIITETQRNTEKTVQKAINGPRPPPASVNTRSVRSHDEMIDDIPNKRRNVFRRALKGLSMRSSNDLAKIEDMLVQLLGDVEGLKVAQGLPGRSPEGDRYDDMQQEGAYEQDRGYEPEGNAGSTTASHASQSGHFSNPLSRGASAPRGDYGRRYSENRISTVPEGDEDELDLHEQAVLNNQFENNEQLLTPVRETARGSSAPLGTPPQQQVAPASLSNENTPTTGKSRKSTWNPIPKISRWSETTASSVAKNFRNSGRRDTHEYQEPHSRSGSDLGQFEPVRHNPYGEDKLHTGLSVDNLNSSHDFIENSPTQLTSLLPPEDPKYKAHRNSLNLQHPQPRPGPTQRYQTALETQAQNFDTPMSPRSAEWGGSSSSINRLPPNSNANPNRYSTDTGHLSPVSDGYSGQGDNGGLAPARPPKEPIPPEIPPKIRNRLTKPHPLSSEHLPDDIGEEYQGSPKSERRVLSANLTVPTRKPTGPRSMGSPRGSGGLASGSGGEGGSGEGRRKRDTFGTIGSNHSGESETF